MKIKVKVEFKVKTSDREKAEEYVDRLMRYGFNALSEYEQKTSKAIKSWQFTEEKK